MIRLAALLSATAVVAATGFAPAAQASTIDGPSSDCAVTAKWSKPTSTTVKVTWTTACESAYYAIKNGMTVQRPGEVETNTVGCRTLGRTVRSCTGSVTISDPGGIQDYVSINEVYIDDTYSSMDGRYCGFSRSTFSG